MAMVVKNNMSAVSTLNTLNKNSSALQKSLQKVSSGMKINSAQDDASGYAISEKMRVQIRSLDQANQNTQNASSLMKTAEGAVSSTVEILKSLKEKAINAATDTNTDSDRVTIQKELDQFIDQIDDNGLTTFNGKYLVDGSKSQRGQATYTAMTNQSLETGTNASTALTALANRNGDSLEIDTTDSITASYVRGGKTHTTTFKVDNQNLGNIFDRLESLESDKIFASSSNTSVTGEGNTVRGDQPAISTTTGITATDSTSSSTSTSSSSGSYTKEDLQAALANATKALKSAKATLEEKNAAAGDFTWDAANKTVLADGDKTYGAAGELAKALEEAALLKSDGTKVADSTTGGDFLKMSTAAVATAGGTPPSFAIGNLTSGTAITGAWNARNLDATDMAASKTNVESVINTMTSSSNTTVAEAGEALKTAYTNYNTAISDLKSAQDTYDAAAKDVEVLTNAITAITAKEEADALIGDMADSLSTAFNALAHPNATTGNTAQTNIKLNNDNWLATKLYPSSTGTQAYDANSPAYQYTGDTDGSLAKAAEGIANDIAKNVYDYATDATTAETFTKNLVKEIGHGDAAANNAQPATITAFAAADYTNAGTDDLTTLAGDLGKPFTEFAAKAGEYITAKKATDANELSGDLAKAVSNNSGGGEGGSSSDIALLTGSYVGSNSSGDAVYTADGTDGVTVTANGEGILGQVSGLTISVTDSDGNVKKAANAALDQFRTTIFAKNKSEANEMTFQVGAAANQSITVGLEDMRSEALGLKGSDGSKVSVATQDKANAAVAVFDNALQKALDQQTTIGAVEARLDYTSQNLTTSSENVQAAESTIRDADMAKEMTNYTKNNVLLQAAQSMLAQANQSSSQVLSLLQ